MTPNDRGWILVSQPVHDTIDEAAMIAALPSEAAAASRRTVSIDSFRCSMAEAPSIDWHRARQATERDARERLRPLFETCPGYRVAYFGAAPIALAMLLGHLVERWRVCRTHQRRHDTGDWRWPSATRTVEVSTEGVPPQVIRAPGEVVLRVATSHAIDDRDVAAVVDRPLADITISIGRPDPDALMAEEDLEEVARAFEKALDEVRERLPGAGCVHVFAAVPVGLAFRMGAAVSSTKHPRVQTYQYVQRAEPRYQPALVLQDRLERTRSLGETERAEAQALRALWQEELDALRGYAARVGQRPDKKAAWFGRILPKEMRGAEAFVGPWQQLRSLHEIGLDSMKVGQQASDLAEFRYDPDRRTWEFGDGLLAAIAARMPTPEARRQAGRLFLLHEGLHDACQRLTTATSGDIGRFPKLLEKVDYQADAWAMLHDWGLCQERSLTSPIDLRAHLLTAIDAALGSFWSFDDTGDELREMQVRRVHRYLLWCWQRLRIERAKSPADVTSVLADRPFIELAGPPVVTHDERVFFDLAPGRASDPEIAVLWGCAVQRFGSGRGTPVADLLDGFRTRRSERVLTVLRSIFDQLR